MFEPGIMSGVYVFCFLMVVSVFPVAVVFFILRLFLHQERAASDDESQDLHELLRKSEQMTERLDALEALIADEERNES